MRAARAGRRAWTCVLLRPEGTVLETFLIATGVVALAELGDKTQLLSLVLAAKYRRPWPICIGIALATLANHALAGFIGELVARWLTPDAVRWVVVASLAAMALWSLVPDRMDDAAASKAGRHGVILATIITFFLAEMGDKTQVATMVLAAQYHPLWQVVVGTTTGMLIANVPVVWLGARFAHKLPLRITRLAAAALFAALAIWIAASGHALP